MQAQWQKKRAEIWNPSIVYSKGQINHYFGNWKGDTPQDILQSGALFYYIPQRPSPAPEAKVAKTDNDSMKGSRIGLLGQTISIIHHSVDLLFFRVQCKQAPSSDVFVYWWASGGFPCSSVICLPCRRSPVLQEIQVPSLVWEDPLEKEMATHSSILAWRIPWTEELAGYSPWGCKESETTEGA